ncbi:hypothetical protein O1L60_13230 [Streptomyces diastatochromogenes]|nr:hypothetical protein [Streptomyces diastatochromogenes]
MTGDRADGAGGADALLTVLELLARQAPPARFDDLLDEARRTGLADGELHRLERAVELAGEVHAARAREARHEDGLAALTDTARDLTSPTTSTACSASSPAAPAGSSASTSRT